MIRVRQISFIVGLVLSLAQGACKQKSPFFPNTLEQNLVWAGPNREQFEQVLQHYRRLPGDSLKYKAAVFLISNMESRGEYDGPWIQRFDSIFQVISNAWDDNEIKRIKDSVLNKIGTQHQSSTLLLNDLRTVTSAYLIQNIDQAFAAWQQAPWTSQVSFNTFCNYILPYKVVNEPKDIWRTDLKTNLQNIMMTPPIPKTMEEFCCAIVESQRTWFRYTEQFSDYPSILSLKNIIRGKHGACGEMAVLGAYASRAFGIPVAVDFTPQWGNHANGHIWNALILRENLSLPFLGAESRPGDYADIRESEGKIAKVYRYNYGYNEASFAAQARKRGITEIPAYLKNPRMIDVTNLYVPAKEVILNIKDNSNTPVYLCVFQNGEWQGLAGSWITKGKLHFYNIGPEVLYMPMYFNSAQYKPAAAPLIISIDDSINSIHPQTNSKINMTLYRKYPVKKFRAMNIMVQALVGAKFEAAQTPEFNNPHLIFTIPALNEKYKRRVNRGYTIRDDLDYASLWEEDTISGIDSFRYIRLIGKPNSTFRLGELAFYTKWDTIALKGTPIGNVTLPGQAFDGWNGDNVVEEQHDGISRWVGIDFGKPYTIHRIRYLPANDHNTILPEKTYEFFYWKDQWISLGVQKANVHQLMFRQVPEGTIYWLHCKDCNSTEERPFTYDKGRQIWW